MKSPQPSNQQLNAVDNDLVTQAKEIDDTIDQALSMNVLPDQFDQIISANSKNSKLFIDNNELD